VQSENARSGENLKNEELDSEEENPNFDSVELENHPEIRKYLDQKYPDDPNEPKKKLIIISAMFRSGSSFLGSLFGMGPKPKQFSILEIVLSLPLSRRWTMIVWQLPDTILVRSEFNNVLKVFGPIKDKNPDLIYYFEPLSGWFSKKTTLFRRNSPS